MPTELIQATGSRRPKSDVASAVVTRGDLAKILGVLPREIGYILNQHADRIKPLRKAGIARLYSADVIEVVRTELKVLRMMRRKRQRNHLAVAR